MAETTVARPVTSNWRAAIGAGLIAGLVFMMLEMIMVPVFLGGSPWAPPRMIGGIVLGQGALPPPATFDLGILLVAMIVHFALSIIYAFILAWVIGRLPESTALLVGALFGLGLYLVNFFGFTALFPWFASARYWVSVFAHVVFGLVAAWAYLRLARPAPAARPA